MGVVRDEVLEVGELWEDVLMLNRWVALLKAGLRESSVAI